MPLCERLDWRLGSVDDWRLLWMRRDRGKTACESTRLVWCLWLCETRSTRLISRARYELPLWKALFRLAVFSVGGKVYDPNAAVVAVTGVFSRAEDRIIHLVICSACHVVSEAVVVLSSLSSTILAWRVRFALDVCRSGFVRGSNSLHAVEAPRRASREKIREPGRMLMRASDGSTEG